MKPTQRDNTLGALKRHSEWRSEELRKRLVYAQQAAQVAERKRAETARLARESEEALRRLFDSGAAVPVDALQRIRSIAHSDQQREGRVEEEHRRLDNLAQAIAGELRSSAVAVKTFERLEERSRKARIVEEQRQAQHQADEGAAQAAARGRTTWWK